MTDCQVMPPLSIEEYEALKADIAKRGVLIPIEVDADTGEILDGFHRLRACQELGITPPITERHFANDQERTEHALILNLLRRQLGPITWAQTFEKLAKVYGVRLGKRGVKSLIQQSSEGKSPTVGDLAKNVGIPYSTANYRLKLAADLADHPDLADKVDRGEMAANQAQRIIQKLKQKVEAEATQVNVLEFEDETKYHAIVIDPPWPVQKILRDVRPNQDIFDYPTMTIEEIAKLPIADLADPGGCHVYLWITHKFLPDGLRLFEQWGVKYQCIMTWIKNVGFTPFSWMYSTEHVLFGRIGSLPLLRKGLRLDFQGKVQKHSRKPDEFYQKVIEVSPNPRIDLFAREPRDGFEVWGNES